MLSKLPFDDAGRGREAGYAKRVVLASRLVSRVLSVAVAASAALPAIADNPTYVLGIPGAPTICLSSDSADNEWLAANANFSAVSIASTTGGVSRVVDLDSPRLELAAAEAGFPFERAKPDYYLADVIEPPSDVDWAATYAAFLSLSESERANFIFDDEGSRLFAAKGGTVKFT